MTPSVSPRLNVDLLEEKFEAWQADPTSVGSTWSAFFEGFALGSEQFRKKEQEQGKEATPEELKVRGQTGARVYAYRTIGHTASWINPIAESPPDGLFLDLDEFGFTEDDLV